MKNVKLALIAAVAVMTTGCAVTKTGMATGGSKADGIVEMSYEIGEFESVTLNRAATDKAAELRCQRWGYDGAEAFGGSTRQCVGGIGAFSSCPMFRVTVPYQCTGERKPVK